MSQLKSRAALLRQAQDHIEYALGEGGSLVERSTFGDMVERWALYAHDSDGNVIPPPTDQHIKISRHHGEPGYCLEFDQLAKIGSGRKLLDAVGAQSRGLRLALEVFHGERGLRWGRPYDQSRAGGVGDRYVSVYPMTKMGRRWAEELHQRSKVPDAFQPDESLANEMVAQKANPNDIRGKRLQHCAEQAKALMGAAHMLLEEIAVERETVRLAIRRTNLAGVR